MTDIRDLFEVLYSRLVLRDFFGKIVPGGLFLISLVYPHILEKGISSVPSMSIWIWLFLIGFSWLLGFAVQALGEVTRLIRYYPKVLEKISWRELVHLDPELRRLNGKGIAGESDKHRGDNNWQEFHNEFDKVAEKEPLRNQQRERFAVIKEACGNASLALALGLLSVALYFALDSSPVASFLSEIRNPKSVHSVVLLIFLIVFLFLMHRIHVNRQYRYMITILRKLALPDKDSNTAKPGSADHDAG